MKNIPNAITKVLSMNDSGETGAHQAGMLIPKRGGVLDFFPDLGNSELNPRVALYFQDDNGRSWKLNFIYYNNKFFQEDGTRNEYRLTGLTAYIRENGLKAGDAITLTHLSDGTDQISYKRTSVVKVTEIADDSGKVKKRLTLGTSWKVVNV